MLTQEGREIKPLTPGGVEILTEYHALVEQLKADPKNTELTAKVADAGNRYREHRHGGTLPPEAKLTTVFGDNVDDMEIFPPQKKNTQPSEPTPAQLHDQEGDGEGGHSSQSDQVTEGGDGAEGSAGREGGEVSDGGEGGEVSEGGEGGEVSDGGEGGEHPEDNENEEQTTPEEDDADSDHSVESMDEGEIQSDDDNNIVDGVCEFTPPPVEPHVFDPRQEALEPQSWSTGWYQSVDVGKGWRPRRTHDTPKQEG